MRLQERLDGLAAQVETQSWRRYGMELWAAALAAERKGAVVVLGDVKFRDLVKILQDTQPLSLLDATKVRGVVVCVVWGGSVARSRAV